ncbi:MAG: hypothetical protein N7Q72_01150, partial [Spiroplasma sp. Tabriz.8]|nr:hypothetical protein [Spiroplasma sp. Tabriz.8]
HIYEYSFINKIIIYESKIHFIEIVIFFFRERERERERERLFPPDVTYNFPVNLFTQISVLLLE